MTGFAEQRAYLAGRADLYSQVSQSRDWQTKYRTLMLAGKELPPLPAGLKRDELRVEGCESAAWLVHLQEQGCHYWGFDSDARIIKGIVSALLCKLNGKTATELQALDLTALFGQLGLNQGLSPSRNNGVAAVLARIGAQLHG